MTRAAARLHLAQPALSQAIATLEAQLGVGLFERHARGVKLTPVGHPLARQGELTVADALDETFISYHRNVQREWAGFHSLDDHRGGPPSSATEDRVLTVPEMLISLTMRRGITIFPASDAAVTV